MDGTKTTPPEVVSSMAGWKESFDAAAGDAERAAAAYQALSDGAIEAARRLRTAAGKVEAAFAAIAEVESSALADAEEARRIGLECPALAESAARWEGCHGVISCAMRGLSEECAAIAARSASAALAQVRNAYRDDDTSPAPQPTATPSPISPPPTPQADRAAAASQARAVARGLGAR